MTTASLSLPVSGAKGVVRTGLRGTPREPANAVRSSTRAPLLAHRVPVDAAESRYKNAEAEGLI